MKEEAYSGAVKVATKDLGFEWKNNPDLIGDADLRSTPKKDWIEKQ